MKEAPDYRRHFTVWRIHSVSQNVTIHRADVSYAGEERDINANQKPVWSGLAKSKEEAMTFWKTS